MNLDQHPSVFYQFLYVHHRFHRKTIFCVYEGMDKKINWSLYAIYLSCRFDKQDLQMFTYVKVSDKMSLVSQIYIEI